MHSHPRCHTFRERVDDLVGRDLSPEDAARLIAHARACPPCAESWRSSLERSAALQALSPWTLEASGVTPPEPGTTADAVFARLAAGEGSPALPFSRRLAAHRGWVRLAVAAAILVSASVGFGSLGSPSVGMPEELPPRPAAEGLAASPAPVRPMRGRALVPVSERGPSFERTLEGADPDFYLILPDAGVPGRASFPDASVANGGGAPAGSTLGADFAGAFVPVSGGSRPH